MQTHSLQKDKAMYLKKVGRLDIYEKWMILIEKMKLPARNFRKIAPTSVRGLTENQRKSIKSSRDNIHDPKLTSKVHLEKMIAGLYQPSQYQIYKFYVSRAVTNAAG